MPAPEPIPDLLKSANEASARGFGLWVTFLTVEIYLAIAAGTTTHRQLLLEGPVKLGASLVRARVWRAGQSGSDTTLADGRELVTTPMLPDEAQGISAMVRKTVPDGPRREAALERLSILSGPVPTEGEQTLSNAAAAWNKLILRGWNEAKDDSELASLLGKLGCEPKDAPHVARGLLRRIDTPSEAKRPYAPLLAKALRDPGCAGASGLTAEEIAKLDQIASTPTPGTLPEPAPGAAASR